MNLKKYLFFALWLILAVFLLFISVRYKSRTEAMVAVVESQVTAVSYQKPVVIRSIRVVPGQEVKKGDTILVVARPDLSLDIDKKTNDQERQESRLIQVEQNFNSKKALVTIETEGKINRLEMELVEIEAKLQQQKSINAKLKGLTGNGSSMSFSDSLMVMRVNSLKQEIRDVTTYARKELERMAIIKEDEKQRILRDIELTKREMLSLTDEYISLIRTANFDGIVGTVGAQLDELIPPFKTVLSIYEMKPTLIKAYVNESISYRVSPGDRVNVVSENRVYNIDGVVLELGARITAFPEKIQATVDVKNYGQEVFIRIPSDNKFLNGEKVFVYPIKEK